MSGLVEIERLAREQAEKWPDVPLYVHRADQDSEEMLVWLRVWRGPVRFFGSPKRRVRDLRAA